MSEFTLSIPAIAMNVESRGVSVSIQVAAIPHDVLRQVILHGIKQKVADAASGAAGLVYMSAKGKDAPKPSREQLADFVEANLKSVQDQTIASMQKAADAMLAGQWQVREASGATTSRWTDEQALAIDIAKAALMAVFAKALKPGVKVTVANVIPLSPKVAAYFKTGESVKRPTWDDKAVMDYITRQVATRDFMAEAREELSRREEANAIMADTSLDELLADL